GVFEELHGFSGGKALAEHLEQAVKLHHGAPFRDWLHHLTQDLPQVRALLCNECLVLTHHQPQRAERAGAGKGAD
ncbi:hypothetical protein, partial [Cronobacter sakazakii]|uniref:hypothetical protein n=1 Tax=Cronobacter sakazakii TaxID=28141 RepID=UPI001F505897